MATWEESFKTKVKGGLDTSYQDTIKAWDDKIAAAEAELQELQNKMESFDADATDTDFLTRIPEVEKKIKFLKDKRAAIPYVKNMTLEQCDAFRGEVSIHYDPLIKEKFKALKTAYETMIPILVDIKALTTEKVDMLNYVIGCVDATDGIQWHYCSFLDDYHYISLVEKLTSTEKSDIRTQIEDLAKN